MSVSYPSFSTLTKHPAHMIAFGFGSGLIRPAPGTWGTLSGLVAFWILQGFLPGFQAQLVATVLLAVIGTWAAHTSSNLLVTHDHPGIVIDEWLGIWMVLLVVPFSLLNWLVAFVLFRLFDIWKPWPIKRLDQHVDGGVGIMIDDVVAGIFAMVVWYVLNHFQVLPL